MLKVRDNLCTSCGLCERVCPSGAISFRYGKAYIDPERCIDCRVCSSVCPSHAIQLLSVNDVAEIKSRLYGVSQRIAQISQRLDRLGSKYTGRRWS